MTSYKNCTIVIPAKNENTGLTEIIPSLIETYPEVEIIVVDDGSTDDTAHTALSLGARVISHHYSKGNGAAIKTGAREAKGDILIFMDADGQHKPEDIPRLLDKINDGYDMAVGARLYESQASHHRAIANYIYNKLASLMTGHKIEDLTSGFRAVRKQHFKKFLYLLPNGFSYPTTSTMAFFRSGLSVAYVPIEAQQRSGKSHIKLLRDGIRFLIIIMKIGALFSPMRFFLPISGLLFLLGSAHYTYTYIGHGRFTNMSALLYLSSLFTFLIGIVSEQISSLHYKGTEDKK